MSEQAEILDDAVSRRAVDVLKLRLAAEIAPRSWRTSISQIVQHLEQGEDLESAVRNNAARRPQELDSLLRESLNAQDPAALLVDVIRVKNETGQSWRMLVSTCAYPAALFACALVVGVAFSFSMQTMVSLDWIDDFGLAGTEGIQAAIEDQHHSIVGLGIVTAWIAVVLVTLFLVGPAWAWLAVVGGMVVVGKPLRWLSLQELLDRYRLFLKYGLQDQEAMDAVARSFRHARQAVYSQAIATRVHQGMPLGQAIGSSSLTDGLCRPIVLQMDQRGQDLQAALSDSSSVLGHMADQRCRSLNVIVPVFALAMVATILFGAMASYLLSLTPLITAISSLA